MTERLTNEILDASNGLGAAVKRREDTHIDGGIKPRLCALPLVVIPYLGGAHALPRYLGEGTSRPVRITQRRPRGTRRAHRPN